MLEEKAVEIIVGVGKLTLQKVIQTSEKCLDRIARLANAPEKTKHGKQSIKQLNKQNRQLEDVVIDDADLKMFQKELRRYGVDFAVKRNPQTQQYHIFYKAQDISRVNVGLGDYLKELKERVDKPLAKKEPFVDRLKRIKEIYNKKREARNKQQQRTKQRSAEYAAPQH